MGEEKKLIISVRKRDLRIDTFRAGGRGGQHQNKTDTGVRITHIESGISTESREERSQTLNKKKAFQKLIPRLIQYYIPKEQKERYSAGTEVIRSYHEPNDRVTDHSSGETWSYKHTIGKGDMTLLIEARQRNFQNEVY